MRITVDCAPEEFKDYRAFVKDLESLVLRQQFELVGHDCPSIPGDRFCWFSDPNLGYEDVLEKLDETEHRLLINNSLDPSKWDLLAFRKA